MRMFMGRIYGLEAVRGIAAVMVALLHIRYFAPMPASANGLFGAAYHAVDLFFLLSGFVLTRTYEHRMPPTGRFVVQRFVRLWPPVACGVLLGAVYMLNAGVIGTNDLPRLALALGTGLAILPLLGGTVLLNPPAWSIFFEIVANAAHSAILRHLSNAGLAAIIAVSALALVLGTRGMSLDVGQDEWQIYGIPRVLMSYTLGVLMYRLNGDRQWVPAQFVWPVLAAYALALTLLPADLPAALGVIFALAIHPLVLLAALSLKESRLAVWLGAFSFPLYATHYPVQALIGGAGMGWMPTLYGSLAAAAVLGLLVDPRWRRLVLDAVRPRAALPTAS